MIKVADYVVNFFGDKGIDKIFIVYGAANGDLVDAFTRTKKKVEYVSIMHEQAAGFAVEGYTKVRGLPGVAIATSGPGGQNFVTPIANCFYDSCAAIFITGQVKTEFQRPDPSIRQIGFQETDIVNIVKPITNYAKMLTDPNTIKYELEKAYYLSTKARPGPVLLDIPMDIQKALIDPEKQKGYLPNLDQNFLNDNFENQIEELISDLEKAKRPVFLIGGGVKNANAIEEFQHMGKIINIPCYPTWNALDVVTSDYSHYCGRVGTYGGAGRNFGIQNADLLISIGSRLSGRITGGNVKSFSRESKKYMIDIDKINLETKWQQLPFDVNIHCDAKEFIKILENKVLNKKKYIQSEEQKNWLSKCLLWKNKYDPVKKDFFKTNQEFVNPYAFVRRLSDKLNSKGVVVADCGGNVVIGNQSFETKKGQRFFSNNGNSPMGYSFAASIGAYYGDPSRDIICIIGDGGMNMNIQELQTIKNYNIKIKTIILNNHIYGITKAYQKTNFEGRMEACGPVGYNPPNFVDIAKAYQVKTIEVDVMNEIDKKIDELLSFDGPVVMDVNCHEHHTYEPRIFGWKTPIEDMYPYLSREEFKNNMIVEPLDDWQNPPQPNEKEFDSNIESAE